MKKKKKKRVELRIRKPLPGKAGGPMTTKKGKKGYDKRRDRAVPEDELEEDRE